ncbi:ATP-binding protein [Ideonella livida]|uniref:histidine kinase n=1 Tax=Ideonella livida TaxID=2707176 RepID=A0A7C9TK06_9BURK|nr:ATP-binding protein [Ideonella livida]NDY90985.1 two-component sensor histidine kinase [Ideonella livida]
MSGNAPTSLHRRLLRPLVLVLGGLWLGSGLLLAVDTSHELDELLDAHLAQSASLLVASQLPGHHDDDGLLDTPQLHRYAPRVAYQVWHEGRLLRRSRNAPATPLGTVAQGFETREVSGQRWRLFAAQGGEADVQVYVAEQVGARREILGGVLRGLLLPLLLVLPAVALLSAWILRRGLAPLHALGRTLAQRPPDADGPLAPAAQPEPAELQPLRQALDSLFARIGQLLAAERRFTADAAHELRTPIAAIRMQAQVAQGAQDEPSRQHALQATLQGCDRATRLVQQLLTLSRLEAAGPAALAPTDLAAVARQVAADLAPGALDRAQTLALEGAELPVPVAGDPTLLGVLLRNLLDNALRYSPDGAQVLLRLHPADGPQGPALVVEDGGPGLGPDDRARLGERFFRVLRPGAAAGSGLGWSIVRRIAAAHGAQVEAGESALLGGLSVRVQWGPTAAHGHAPAG